MPPQKTKATQFTGKRGRPPKAVIDIELTKVLPEEADRIRFRSMWNEFTKDFPNLNNSSDRIILKDFILSSILRDNIHAEMNSNNKSRILDKDINKILNDLDSKIGDSLEILNARRRDRPKETDNISIVDLAKQYDLEQKAESRKLDELEEMDLLKKKFSEENASSRDGVVEKIEPKEETKTENNNV